MCVRGFTLTLFFHCDLLHQRASSKMLELIKSFVTSVENPGFDVVKSNAEILVLRDHETGKKSVVNSYPAASKSTSFFLRVYVRRLVCCSCLTHPHNLSLIPQRCAVLVASKSVAPSCFVSCLLLLVSLFSLFHKKVFCGWKKPPSCPQVVSIATYWFVTVYCDYAFISQRNITHKSTLFSVF